MVLRIGNDFKEHTSVFCTSGVLTCAKLVRENIRGALRARCALEVPYGLYTIFFFLSFIHSFIVKDWFVYNVGNNAKVGRKSHVLSTTPYY